MRRSNKKIGKHLASTGRNPTASKHYRSGIPRDCSVPLRQEESEAGNQRGIKIFQKAGPGLDPNTDDHKGIFDMGADNAYHAVYPDAPKHIPYANHPCAYAWLRIRAAVANGYRKAVIQTYGASGGPSINYGYKGADNKPVFDQRYMTNGASFSSTPSIPKPRKRKPQPRPRPSSGPQPRSESRTKPGRRRTKARSF